MEFPLYFKSLRAELFFLAGAEGITDMSFHYTAFIYTEMAQAIKTVPREVNDQPFFLSSPFLWLSMTWRRNRPVQQQPRRWCDLLEIIRVTLVHILSVARFNMYKQHEQGIIISISNRIIFRGTLLIIVFCLVILIIMKYQYQYRDDMLW